MKTPLKSSLHPLAALAGARAPELATLQALRDGLPKTIVGKLDRKALRAEVLPE